MSSESVEVALDNDQWSTQQERQRRTSSEQVRSGPKEVSHPVIALPNNGGHLVMVMFERGETHRNKLLLIAHMTLDQRLKG